MSESVEEHNRRQTEILGQFIQDVEDAKTLLKKCEYVVYTKKEFEENRSQLKFYVAMLILFSIGFGFAACMIFVKTK